MSCNNFFPTTDKDINKCEIEVNVCDDVMSCACCCYFLEKHKQIVVDEILEEIEILPTKITRIKVPVYPLPDNKFYYSFDGLSTIVYNLLKTENPKQKQAVAKHDAFLKIYYEKNSLFNLPIIQIELIYFGELKSKSIDEYWRTLKAEVLFFTGSVGDIDVISINGLNHLEEILRIPLLFGYPEFKYEGALRENGFTLEQINEMNYLHSMQVQQMEMGKVINDRTLDLFVELKEVIKNKDNKKANRKCNMSDEDIVRAIFNDDVEFSENNIDDEIEDELPF